MIVSVKGNTLHLDLKSFYRFRDIMRYLAVTHTWAFPQSTIVGVQGFSATVIYVAHRIGCGMLPVTVTFDSMMKIWLQLA